MLQNRIWQPYQENNSCYEEQAFLGSSELSMCSQRKKTEEDAAKRIAELIAEYGSSHDMDPAILLGTGQQ